MKNVADTVVMVVCGLALLAALSVAQAQGLADPTRPPAASASGGAAPAVEAAPTGLQAIIVSNCGKPAAIINGEFVLLGGRVGEGRLVKIADDSVTVKTGATREILKLIPGVEKKEAAPGQVQTPKGGVAGGCERLASARGGK